MSVVDLHVWDVDRVLPALGRMATGRRALRGTPGLRFAKLLGTGSGTTFTPRDADPHRWALLTVWDSAGAADAADLGAGPGPGARVVRGWRDAAREELRVRMTPLAARGAWSGEQPFAAVPRPGWDGPVAAITRARLRPTRALSFWRAVPPVVTGLHAADGLRLALGVGEAPVGLQGTFSLWRSSADLVAYAYRDDAHRAVMARTEPERWYAEELFARFAVLDVRGSTGGSTP